MNNAETDTAALPVASRRQTRTAFLRALRHEKRFVALTVLLNGIATGAGVVAPLYLGRIVDEIAAGTDVAGVDRQATVLVAAIAAIIVFTWWGSWVSNVLGERVAARLREDFVDSALTVPMSVAEGAGSGDLVTRTTSDIPNAVYVYQEGFHRIVICALQATAFLTALVWLSPLLALCVLIAVPTMATGTRWYLKRARAAYIRERASESVVGEALTASAAGARTTEAFGLREQRADTVRSGLRGFVAANKRTVFLRCVFYPTLDGSYLLPTAAILLLGGLLWFNGSMSLGTVSACAILSRQASYPVDGILTVLEGLQKAFASLSRVEGIRLLADGARREASAREPEDTEIVLDNVHFSYDGHSDVVSGVSFSVASGERTAIVGTSGAGKTTLARLISGTDAPSRGSVRVGNVEVSQLSLEQRRRLVVVVSQDHHVFSASLRDNLLLAESNASDAQLWEALRLVGADWASALPQGLDTLLGGQEKEIDPAAAQQISLARVILADPAIVVLDEATSTMNPVSAHRTEESIAEVLKGRTVIAIAHRLQTARDADRVIVMDSGRVVESGGHSDLVDRDGTYASLWRAWQGEQSVSV
ncbi:ABC transporter ATP-binding protein [Haloglycomyces albus]|uniref:ABC transporter ATP-binding protein n=1 Tax=Haloglycomyces albus TaxID=526067 RepID=UPI00046CCDC6|nr:ABC transporter ATP-binding protein [Haloglycomyces albus]